ncbi:MAG: hypothetical protein AB1461_00270 [Thermodesulfobacteriota bacterium]|jgi:hypothetical protein
MKKTMVLFVLCASCFLGTPAGAGVEPSPFKEVILAKIALIIERLQPLTAVSPTGEPDDVQALATEVVNSLGAVDELSINHHLTTMQSVIIMERISSVLFDPQPEPPGYQLNALKTLLRLTSVSFDPQPEPPGHITKSLAILDRISAVGINPQPEPPGVETLVNTIDALEGISAIAFDPQPEPPGKASEVMAVFDGISAVAFDPQPEPPGQPVAEMFRILDLLEKIAFPTAVVPVELN